AVRVVRRHHPRPGGAPAGGRGARRVRAGDRRAPAVLRLGGRADRQGRWGAGARAVGGLSRARRTRRRGDRPERWRAAGLCAARRAGGDGAAVDRSHRLEPGAGRGARRADDLGRAHALLLHQRRAWVLRHDDRAGALCGRARGAGASALMFALPFVRNALLAGSLIAAASGLLGYFIVLRAQVLAGDALSHVAFTGALAAAAAGVDLRIGLFAATVLGALNGEARW